MLQSMPNCWNTAADLKSAADRDRVLDLRFAMGAVANDLPDPYIHADRLRAPGVPMLRVRAPSTAMWMSSSLTSQAKSPLAI